MPPPAVLQDDLKVPHKQFDFLKFLSPKSMLLNVPYQAHFPDLTKESQSGIINIEKGRGLFPQFIPERKVRTDGSRSK